ncbi:TPA: hypothetical protein ACRRW7_003515 [Morganella morganii]
MKSTPFTEMATVFRGQIVRLWTLQNSGTQAETAAVLTDAAINLGYITRSRPVPGAALLSWLSNPNKTPLWAAQTALTLMLRMGWKPESNQDWCGMTALIFRANRTLPLEQLVASLPESIDRKTVTGWFVAAIEEDAHYRYNRKFR